MRMRLYTEEHIQRIATRRERRRQLGETLFPRDFYGPAPYDYAKPETSSRR